MGMPRGVAIGRALPKTALTRPSGLIVRILDRQPNVARRSAVEIESTGNSAARSTASGRKGRDQQMGAALPVILTKKLHHVVLDG